MSGLTGSGLKKDDFINAIVDENIRIKPVTTQLETTAPQAQVANTLESDDATPEISTEPETAQTSATPEPQTQEAPEPEAQSSGKRIIPEGATFSTPEKMKFSVNNLLWNGQNLAHWKTS